MKQGKNNHESIRRDAAIAAAMVIVEEFFPHCPNGIAGAIHDRLCEIIEAGMESVEAVRWHTRHEPSDN